ncbi:hypothetical protein [Gloeocapsopsis dulcis]|uniref:hypothetical protein n=1 Tax=Gloeocapsopsis dulcis TaxID=2859516 RepID=UPI003BB4F300
MGHYLGSLQNRVKLQHDYETYILIADVQALTDNFATPERLQANIREVMLDYLAVGLDPNRCCFVVQSRAKSWVCSLTLIAFMELSQGKLRAIRCLSTMMPLIQSKSV